MWDLTSLVYDQLTTWTAAPKLIVNHNTPASSTKRLAKRGQCLMTLGDSELVKDHCCAATLVWYLMQYFFDALHLRCIASLVLCICIFGMLCIGIFGVHNRWCDYYCAMHLWCIVSWSWVQYIFGIESLVLWYALSAILHRLATAVAHLLYCINWKSEKIITHWLTFWQLESKRC